MATAASRPSSSRGRAALWLVAAALAAAIVVGYLVVDRGNGRRDDVAAYVEQANDVQRGLLTRLGTINTAYSQLRLDPKAAAKQAPKLAAAERTIADARRRLATLVPPADARVLHVRLLRLLAVERGLAADLTELARHLSLVTTGMQALATSTTQLSKDLRDGTSGTAQASAFRRYSARLDAESARLSKASVPVLLKASRREDVARLGAVSATAAGLGKAIANEDADAVGRLLERLERQVRAAAGVPGGKALVTAYNRRVREVAAARVAVERELRRLDREL